ncbi:hypothetical protein EW15_1957 [Prochlorococcus sp. MIT 0801]|nr:hypothetical protein EW15_1957 [Prochlorococcus sp. MIT 0801]
MSKEPHRSKELAKLAKLAKLFMCHEDNFSGLLKALNMCL